MQITVESAQAGITVLRPIGALDMSSVPDFHQRLAAEVKQATRGLVLALAEVDFMDSSGIAVLIEGLKWSRSRLLPYVLTQLTPGVRMVMELARLENFFTIVDSVDEAITTITKAS